MSQNITDTQKKILEYIIEQKSIAGFPPTLAEIAEKFGYRNRSTVRQHLEALEKKGFIRRRPGLSRGIEVLLEDKYFVTKPVLGEVAAGNPLTIYPGSIDTIKIPSVARMPGESFLLRVKGDSLKDAYIFDGDVVIVNPNLAPVKDNFVVAILDDAAVVKRFVKKEDSIELHSENPEYEPIIVRKNDPGFRVVGVVIGIYRSMDKKTG